MSTAIPGRMTAEIDGNLVVFRIGMGINRWWKIRGSRPVAPAMPKMRDELQRPGS